MTADKFVNFTKGQGLRCYTCVHLLGKTDTPVDFIINGQGVCADHIDAVVADPGALAVVISRTEKLSTERAAELAVKHLGEP